MSQDSSDDDPKRVRVMINGQEVDPNNLPANLIEMKKTKNQPKESGCMSCFGCLIALVVVGSTGFGLLVAASAIFNFNIPGMNALMSLLAGVEAPQTQSIKTDPNHFDPFVGLAQAREFAAPDALLISIGANYVRSDGTMDLNASYNPRTDYKFVRKIPRPEDAPPVGVSGSTNGQWYEPISIQVYRPGTRRSVSVSNGGTRVSYSYTNEGMVRDADDPTTSLSGEVVSDPECTAQKLWSIALENDAPADAVAVINYDVDGYDFIISGVTNLYFTSDCKLKD